MSRPGITLLILGAGCSVSSGYPLARDFVTRLAAYREACFSYAKRLLPRLDQTLKLFDQLREVGAPAETLDDLARLVHQGKLGQRANHVVEDAKHAVAAMFLAAEGAAVQRGLAEYRSLLRRIFADEYGTSPHAALKRTPYRVLTFNYDRLFELAFRQFFEVDCPEAFYGPTCLNSGLLHLVPDVEVDPDRFSLLKLHGSVGVWSDEWRDPCRYSIAVPDPKAPGRVEDAIMVLDSPNSRGHVLPPIPSLVVFPHVKALLTRYPDNRAAFKAYIPKVWKAACDFASQAETVEIIGYSCPEPDFPFLQRLLEAAASCRRIVIHNTAAGVICRRLRSRLPAMAEKFEPYEASFGE